MSPHTCNLCPQPEHYGGGISLRLRDAVALSNERSLDAASPRGHPAPLGMTVNGEAALPRNRHSDRSGGISSVRWSDGCSKVVSRLVAFQVHGGVEGKVTERQAVEIAVVRERRLSPVIRAEDGNGRELFRQADVERELGKDRGRVALRVVVVPDDVDRHPALHPLEIDRN